MNVDAMRHLFIDSCTVDAMLSRVALSIPANFRRCSSLQNLSEYIRQPQAELTKHVWLSKKFDNCHSDGAK